MSTSYRKTASKIFAVFFVLAGLLFAQNTAFAAMPTYIGSGGVGASQNAVTPSLPSGIQTNDILLMVIETANQTITIPTPNGGTWTEVSSSPQGTGTAGGTSSTRLTVFWSRYNGTQGNPTTSDSGDHQRARIFAFRGIIETGNPWDVTYGSILASASTAVSIPGGTTTSADDLIVALVANGTDTNTAQCGGTWTNASLTNLVERSGDNTSQGNGGGACLATGEKVTAGAFNTTTTTLLTSSTQGLISIALKPKPNTTTLGTDTDPSSSTIAPGASATVADAFTLQTNTGTDAITSVVVGLGTSVYAGIGLVEITNDADSVVYGSVTNPGSDTPSISLSGLTATNLSTIYRIRVTPKSHANMPAVPGATYLVTAKINSWTGTNTQAGSDTAGATITIDNLSPSNVTTPTASTAGDTQATIRYTTPADTDLGSAVILKNTVAITGTPTEGATYMVGDPVGSDTVACVDPTITASTADSCIASSLTNGTTYFFKIFMKDTNGNYSQTGVVSNPSSLTPNGTITLGNGTDPGNSAILAPGGPATMADAFTFQASTGTNNVTAVVVGLATGTYVGLGLVEITDDAGTTVYGSAANPSSDAPSVTLSTPITTTTSPVQYKIRVTPKSHANMPAVPGATYLVTAKINSWTSSYAAAGSDTAGTTVTIDNASPSGATSVSGSTIDARVTLNWTTSNSADFNTTSGSVIYRWTGTSAGTEVPAEGSTASVPSTNGTATIACVISSALSTPLSKIDGTGGSIGCNTTALTNGQPYTYKVFQKDSNGNYDTGVTIGTFTPNAAPTLSVVEPAAGNTNVATGSSYNVTYILADPDSVATAAFYYDTNSDGVGGVPLTGACATAAEGTGATCSFNTSVLTTGVPYYIYGVASDGVNASVTAVSAGTITVNAAPTLSVAEPDGINDTVTQNNPYDIRYSLADPDNIVTAAFYYDTDNTGLNGTAITGPCAAAPEGAGVTCSWNTTGVTPGSYYIYGITNDGTNPQISAYSSGVVTIGARITTISNFVTAEPSNTTIAPGASGVVDSFGLATNAGTDTMTGVIVTLALGTGTRVATVAITNDTDTVTYCSATPSGDAATLTGCAIPVSTTNTQFKIKITAVPHASMPAVPGSEYGVTGTVTSFTSTNTQAGSDSASATVTIDNLSPANVTSSTGTTDDTSVALAWTNPLDSDFASVIVLHDTSPIANVPAEGATYTVGDIIGTATVACVVASPADTCTDTAATNGLTYHYKIFARDTNGNYSATGVVPAGSPFTPAANTTTLGNGTDPANASLAPGGAATMSDSFTFTTNRGTEAILSVVVGLATGTSGGLSLIEITNDAGTIVYGSTTNPTSDTPSISLSGLTATSMPTAYKVRITPKGHANMAVPPGSTYAVTTKINSWTGTYTHTGSDTPGTVITIDNESPSNVTATSGAGGNAQVSLNWTTSASADFSRSVVLRWTALTTASETPAEGTDYTIGNTIGTAMIACVRTADASSTAVSSIDGVGTGNCSAAPLTNGQPYSYKVFQKDSSGNYDLGTTFAGSPFTPTLTTFTIFAAAGAHGSITPLATTTVPQGGSQAYNILPDSEYDVATLTVDGGTIATSTTYTFTNVHANHTISATFAATTTPTFTIIASAGAHGSISPLATTTISQGGSQTYSITPDSGYDIATLTVDGLSLATSTSYSFTNIEANHTISATFIAISTPTFTVTATAGAHGSISPGGITVVAQGGSQAYVITPDSGYEISTLVIDGTIVAPAGTHTFASIQTNHTIEATFTAVPAPAAGGPAAPEPSAIRPTTITYSGKAFPHGEISIIDKQLNTETVVGQDYLTQEDGSFNISFIGVLQALHSFGVIAKDKDGRVSQTKLFFVNTISDSLTEKNILLSPTIGLENGQVTRGDSAIITGYAVPGNTVHLELDGILTKDALAGPDGAYKFEVPTGVLEFGPHTARTKQTDPSGKLTSDLSVSRTFIVSRLLVVQADLNGDGKIDIRDWSIFLSLWSNPKAIGRERIDFNKDGKVDIADFSIFVKTLRR